MLVPPGLEPGTLRLLAVRSDQLSYRTTRWKEISAIQKDTTLKPGLDLRSGDALRYERRTIQGMLLDVILLDSLCTYFCLESLWKLFSIFRPPHRDYFLLREGGPVMSGRGGGIPSHQWAVAPSSGSRTACWLGVTF